MTNRRPVAENLAVSLSTKPEMNEPATYRVFVSGSLNESWSERLAGMTIVPRTTEDGERLTILVGRLQDQAALAGLLYNLYLLHCPLVRVEYLADG